jgi:serine/threonine-protein kinase
MPEALSTAAAAAVHDDSPPFEIDGLRMIRLLARGGFAEVWEAEQVSLGRRVAVKILRHEHLGQEQMVQLFEQESRVLARLNHPNVVQVIDRGTTARGPYFVMEYVEGETLQQLVSRGRLSRDRALSILLQAARGLAYAHRNRVIHRDVKPANILISCTGQVKLTDFGIAAVRARAGEDERPEGKQTALGTRAYMAPEQRVSFDDVGPEADVYSMGVILHRIVTGKLPAGPGQLAADVAIPERLGSVLRHALAGPPGQRFAHGGEFREALIDALEGRHIEAGVRRGAARTLGAAGRFELLDVIRQDERRSVYLVSKGGADGERIVVKRYIKDPEALRTVRNLIRIEHPNIVRIHAVGERDDAFIMLMEHLPGGDLRERLVQPHAWQDAVRVGQQVAQALACTASHGIVHGNLRPSNILFDERGRVRVTDFGLPEHYVDEPKRNWYAPPEGGRSTASDLYALGAVLYEMLFAAQPPENAAAVLAAHPPRGLPVGLVEVLGKLLAAPAERYTTPEQVVRDLDALTAAGEGAAPAGQPRSGRAADAAAPARSRPLPVAGLVGLAGLAAVWVLEQPSVQQALVDFFAR